jgi:carboxypeptidase Q
VQYRAELNKVDAVLVSDTGSGSAYGWYDMGRTDEKTALEQVESVLSGLGSEAISPDTQYIFSTDHIGFELMGVPALVLWIDMKDYKEHRAGDTFDSVKKPLLLQGDATVISTAYAIANASVPFAAHLTSAQVEEILRQSGNLDEYKKQKALDLLP